MADETTGGERLRVVRAGERRGGEPPGARPPSPPTELEIKAFAAAPPGWTAWFLSITSDGEHDDPRGEPIAGFATVKGKIGDRIVPIVMSDSDGFQMLDPRSRQRFLGITPPGDTMASYKEALSEQRHWGTRERWLAKHREVFAPASICLCRHQRADLCALVAGGMEPTEERCDCVCHWKPFLPPPEGDP